MSLQPPQALQSTEDKRQLTACYSPLLPPVWKDLHLIGPVCASSFPKLGELLLETLTTEVAHSIGRKPASEAQATKKAAMPVALGKQKSSLKNLLFTCGHNFSSWTQLKQSHNLSSPQFPKDLQALKLQTPANISRVWLRLMLSLLLL